tara:strand:+ start:1781 stop:2350 length:570 start_codon:yes stop_codon:yes gene_type:complete
LKQIVSVLVLLTISGCSLLQQSPREVEIITKPVKVDITQPVMPRPIDLKEPKWYVVSDSRIVNPCAKEFYNPKQYDDKGQEKYKRPKMDHPDGLLNEKGKIIRVCKLGKENPDWPEDYTYLDRFIEDIKKKHGGDTVFFAMTVEDYELMAYNTQEIKRYINQLGEVIVYYRNVTIDDEDAAAVEVKVEE